MRSRQSIRRVLTVLGFMMLSGCDPAAEPVVPVLTDGPLNAEDVLPEPEPLHILFYLEREDFRNNWKIWPGQGPMSEGSEPHGILLTTYLNDLAYAAVENPEGSMPYGAMIIKDNFSAEQDLVASTLMYKRGGGASSWFWLKWQPDGGIDAFGTAQSCIDCHGMAEQNDYILTESISP
jgi:hypothetical protein